MAGAPHWLPVELYLVMERLCVAAWEPLTRTLPGAALGWLAAGGIIYTLGTVVFATQRPRLWPGKFSYHEL